jgi:hypothetical protein
VRYKDFPFIQKIPSYLLPLRCVRVRREFSSKVSPSKQAQRRISLFYFYVLPESFFCHHGPRNVLLHTASTQPVCYLHQCTPAQEDAARQKGSTARYARSHIKSLMILWVPLSPEIKTHIYLSCDYRLPKVRKSNSRKEFKVSAPPEQNTRTRCRPNKTSSAHTICIKRDFNRRKKVGKKRDKYLQIH